MCVPVRVPGASIERWRFDATYSIDRVGLVTIVLACGGRWPSQLSGSLAKASISSSSFSSARWVTSVMGHTGGCTWRFQVPRKLNRFHMSLWYRTLKQACLRAKPEFSTCTSALPVTLCLQRGCFSFSSPDCSTSTFLRHELTQTF